MADRVSIDGVINDGYYIETIEESMVDVGTYLSVVDNVVEAAKSTDIPPIGFALIRPGESHLFNTVAIAARYVQRVHRLKRILIIDFDVCYGCQTSSTFYDDPDVLYLSTHELGAFPNIEGLIENIGRGSGEGTTINVELPDLTGDVAMRNVFDEVIEPAAKRFEPDIILVSAGLHNTNQFVHLECRNLNEPLTTIDFLLHICDSFEISEVKKYLLFVIQTGFTLGRYLSFGSIAGERKWPLKPGVTQIQTIPTQQPRPVAAQLAAIASSMELLQREVAAVIKTQQTKQKDKSSGGFNQFEDEGSSGGNQRRYRPYNKIDFPTFSDGDPRGWILKAEKYFRYYNVLEEERVDVAAMHLEGDALDLYSWLSTDQNIEYWKDFVQYKSTDKSSPNCPHTNWPEHCLLGLFLYGLKDDLKADVRIHKPRTVYKAMSIVIEFESKVVHTKFGKSLPSLAKIEWVPSKPTKTFSLLSSTATAKKPTEGRLSDVEKQGGRYILGECFRCGDKYDHGHRYKTGTFKFLKIADEGNEHRELKLITHFISPFGVQIGNGDVLRCNRICNDVVLQVSDLQIKQNFYQFALGGADVVLGIQWLATLNTVQANWKEMFMKFTIDGKEYKLQGLPPNLQLSATFSHLTAEIVDLDNAGPAAQFPLTRLEDKSSLGAGCIDTNRVHAGLGQVRSNQAQLQVDRGKRGGGKSGGK
ncbi:retrotransposon gag domain, Retroviral aspartyl protease [Artemisia annua]|uniref:Retrotransposon gag domain, Retroviral aspartyl protease n=1 Tax=Artemisia annua TaxID=35608 RepID=A0A2U1PFL6_ARTAN|nr:retrotransposon gag domain, Retroviral aspartyl protease [Artemisia annua]